MLRSVTAIAGAVALSIAFPVCATEDAPALDWLITGGIVIDGSGGPPREADIGIRGDRVVLVGDGSEATAANRLDASGMVVTPGFIDPHTHTGSDLLSRDTARRANAPYLFQGVTTVVIGNDGDGTADIAMTAERMEQAGIGTNVAMLVGFGAVRSAVIGDADRAPSEGELEQMRVQVEQAMCEGAFGFSTGLHYTPQAFAMTDEIVTLAREAGLRGGYYDTHLRDEASYSIGLLAAAEEALEIGRSAPIPVHFAHIKALGPDVWGQSASIIAMIEAAQATGQDVTADQYPWRASGTRVSNALVPRPALDGGLDGFRARIADPQQRDSIVEAMHESLRLRGGAETILITRGIGEPSPWEGSTLAEVAEAIGVGPIDAALAILTEGDARVASFNMDPADIMAFAVRDWVMTGSDGSTGHPRKYATYPRAFADLVTGGAMPIQRFVQRSTGMPAERLGLTDRGYLREGAFADILVFDPAAFEARADYSEPEVLSAGVHTLFVNGVPALMEGERAATDNGRVLLHSAPEGTCP